MAACNKKCCLSIRVCTFPRQGREFCWSTQMVKVHFRWMFSIQLRMQSPTSRQKLSSVRTSTITLSGLWNNKEKCVSLWSFVARWQWADADKSLDRWRLTCCDYLPLLELTVHQSRRQWEHGSADSIVARDRIFMIQWPQKNWEKVSSVSNVLSNHYVCVLLFRFTNI